MGVDRKDCPFCGEEIAAKALKCRFCGEWFEKPAETRAGAAASFSTEFGEALAGMRTWIAWPLVTTAAIGLLTFIAEGVIGRIIAKHSIRSSELDKIAFAIGEAAVREQGLGWMFLLQFIMVLVVVGVGSRVASLGRLHASTLGAVGLLAAGCGLAFLIGLGARHTPANAVIFLVGGLVAIVAANRWTTPLAMVAAGIGSVVGFLLASWGSPLLHRGLEDAVYLLSSSRVESVSRTASLALTTLVYLPLGVALSWNLRRLLGVSAKAPPVQDEEVFGIGDDEWWKRAGE